MMSVDSPPTMQPGLPSQATPQLNLKRLEKIQRWLQYGALVVLLIFIGLIALSWLELRQIKSEIDLADSQLQVKKNEIKELTANLDQLKSDKKGLLEINGALTTVTRSIGQESPKQAQRLKQSIEDSLTETNDGRQIPARVYIHISSEDQRPFALNIAKRLQSNGYIVPGIENVGDKAPPAADLRYFQKDDGTLKEVQDIHDKCSGWGLKLDVPNKPLSGHGVRPRHYEIWFGRSPSKEFKDRFELKTKRGTLGVPG